MSERGPRKDFWDPGAVLFLDLGTSEKGTFQFMKTHQDLHLCPICCRYTIIPRISFLKAIFDFKLMNWGLHMNAYQNLNLTFTFLAPVKGQDTVSSPHWTAHSSDPAIFPVPSQDSTATWQLLTPLLQPSLHSYEKMLEIGAKPREESSPSPGQDSGGKLIIWGQTVPTTQTFRGQGRPSFDLAASIFISLGFASLRPQ